MEKGKERKRKRSREKYLNFAELGRTRDVGVGEESFLCNVACFV